MTAPTRRTSRLALALALAAAALLGAPSPARPEAPPASQLVAEANRKVRQRDVAGAIRLLEQAIAAEPSHLDAQVRYQDLVADTGGAAALAGSYAEAARKRPGDVVAQFLAARLLPPENAIEAFERLAAQFPDSPWPHAGKARALEQTGRFADAAPVHGDALARAGDREPRFLAYRAYGYERAAQWSLAAAAWRSVVERDPKDLAARLGLAEALRRDGDPDGSLAALAEAAKVGAPDPEIAYRRGLAHADAARWDPALAAFDEAVAADKGMVEALCAASEAALLDAVAKARAAKAAVGPKEVERALAYGRRASQADPASGYAHFVTGAAHEAAVEGDPDPQLTAALQEYDLALERLPLPGADRVRALTAKSFIHLQRAEWDPALDAAQKALDVDKGCVVAYGHAGHALAAQGRQQEAISRFYRPGLKADPRSARLHHDLGVALWELKKEQEARKPLEEARTLDPRNGAYRLSLGEYYYATKKPKEAVVELVQATDLLPRDPAAWRAYARACLAAKEWQQCVDAYRKVVELVPETTEEWLCMAVVLHDQLDDREGAKAAIVKFREKGGESEALASWMDEVLGSGQ